MKKPTLLALFAHPDDEAFSSGGTLAYYAAQGVEVYLVCSTRGESGKNSEPSLGEITDMGAWREGELRDACQHLGIHPPIFLGYHDSGRQERTQHANPLASMNIDLFEIETKLLEIIRQIQPDVMLTFDPHGGYGHPDHLVIQRASLGAFYRAGHLEYPPQRLFYTAMPLQRMQSMAQAMGGGIFAELDLTVYGVADNTIAVTLDVTEYAEQKQAAILAHRSQTGALSMVANLPIEIRTAWLGTETFALGATRTAIGQWPLAGFFEGLGMEVK